MKANLQTFDTEKILSLGVMYINKPVRSSPVQLRRKFTKRASACLFRRSVKNEKCQRRFRALQKVMRQVQQYIEMYNKHFFLLLRMSAYNTLLYEQHNTHDNLHNINSAEFPKL